MWNGARRVVNGHTKSLRLNIQHHVTELRGYTPRGSEKSGASVDKRPRIGECIEEYNSAE